MILNAFLLGVIATGSLTASAFFLKFWRRTHDSLFLFFGLAFAIEGLNRFTALYMEHPNQGSTLTYIVRLIAYLLILLGILIKNYGTKN